MSRRRYKKWAETARNENFKPEVSAGAESLPDTPGLRPIAWKPPNSISDAVTEAASIDARIDVAVETARHRGASWTQIGTALGTSRQAAWSRFRQTCLDVEVTRSRAAQLAGALDSLTFLVSRARDIQATLENLVGDARTAGVAWETIAEQLGVRPQSAWGRYGAQ
jgi:hypothetical protein